MGSISPNLQRSQQNQIEDISDRRRRLAGQVRMLLDEIEGSPFGAHLQGKANEERNALRDAYRALCRARKDQRA